MQPGVPPMPPPSTPVTDLPPVVGTSTPPTAEVMTHADGDYGQRGAFDLHVTLTFDPGSLMEGLEVVPQFTVLRGSWGRLGAFAGAAVMGTLFGQIRTQAVVYAPVGAFGALRLGSSPVEVQMRGGALFGGLFTLGTSVVVAKVFGGIGGFLALGARGSGIEVGVDFAGIEGFVALVRAGYVF